MDTEFRRRHFGLDVRDGFQRVSVIASMIDMVEFAYGVRRRRRALVGSLARGHQYPPFDANPIIGCSGCSPP